MSFIERVKKFFLQIKRKTIVRVALIYLVGSLSVLHWVELVFPFLHIPEGFIGTIVILSVVGLPITIIMSWAVTPIHGGIDEECEKKYSRSKIIVGSLTSTLLLIVSLVIYYRLDKGEPAKDTIRIGIASEFGDAIESYMRTYFVAKGPTYNINFTKIKADEYDEARSEFKTGDYDIVMIDDPWVKEYEPILADFSRLKDWNDDKIAKLKDQFFQPLIDVCLAQTKDKCKLIGLPITANVHLMLYRKDLIDKRASDPSSQLPIHINSAIDNAIIHRDSFLQKNILPLGVQFDINNSITEIFWELLRIQDYTDSVNAKGEVIINRKLADNALQWLRRATDGKPDRTLDIPMLVDDLTTGKIAIAFGWPNWVLEDGNFKRANDIGIWKVSPHPVLGSWILAVPEKSNHKKLAAEIICDLTSNMDLQKVLAQNGVAPVLQSFSAVNLKNCPFWCDNFEIVKDAIKASRPRPRMARWSQVEDNIGTQVVTGIAHTGYQFKNVPGLIVFN